MKIKEIMEQDAYICKSDATIADVLRYLAEKKVSGVPIVDEDMKVVGFISDGDIMGYISRRRPILLDFYDHTSVVYDEVSFEQKLESLMERTAMDLATTRVITVEPDDEMDEVANILSKKKIKKVPVVDENDKLIGVVSRSTIVRHIMRDIIEKYEEL